jgi:hypothetical protein
MRKGIDLVEIGLSRLVEIWYALDDLLHDVWRALRRDGVEAATAGILSLKVLRLGTHEVLPGLSSTGPIIGANLLRQSLLGLP